MKKDKIINLITDFVLKHFEIKNVDVLIRDTNNLVGDILKLDEVEGYFDIREVQDYKEETGLLEEDRI